MAGRGGRGGGGGGGRGLSAGAVRALLPTNESASLWNWTLSPGWTEDEVSILHKALTRFGVGNWSQIMESGCLPGKTNAQLNNQTQRMLGQQSTAEFAGLHIDVLEVGKKNSTREGPDIRRKNGIIVNAGDKLRPEEIKKKIEENRALYEMPRKQWEAIELPKPSVEAVKLAQLEEKRAELRMLKMELKDVQNLIAKKEAEAAEAAEAAANAPPEKKARVDD